MLLSRNFIRPHSFICGKLCFTHNTYMMSSTFATHPIDEPTVINHSVLMSVRLFCHILFMERWRTESLNNNNNEKKTYKRILLLLPISPFSYLRNVCRLWPGQRPHMRHQSILDAAFHSSKLELHLLARSNCRLICAHYLAYNSDVHMAKCVQSIRAFVSTMWYIYNTDFNFNVCKYVL